MRGNFVDRVGGISRTLTDSRSLETAGKPSRLFGVTIEEETRW
jgi:hypothetical protein